MDDVLKQQNPSQDNQSPQQNSSSDAAIAPDSVLLCQKCSKRIVHAAYKYDGCTFHAVCLKCNFCARNLSAKPFIIEETRIFCSDHCKKNFEGAAAVTTESIPNQEDPEPLPAKKKAEDSSEGESLIEVLQDIEEGKIEPPPPKLSKKGSPIVVINHFEEDPDRLTDYPRIHSPEAENLSRRSSLSMSAVSESSLTSEGSSLMSYDANKVPKKKILKNPHRQKKHSRNHVKWNLPVGDESDSSSVYSYESSSEVYGRARSGVAEVRHGWKGEFELSPPRGSTGLTPGKHLGYRKIHHMHQPHHQLYHQQNHRQQPHRMQQIHSDSSLLGYTAMNHLPAPTSQALLGGSSLASPNQNHSFSATDLPHVNLNRRPLPSSASFSPQTPLREMSSDNNVYQKSTSPLASSNFTSNQKQLNYAHSTPLPHSHSESALAARMKAMNSPNNHPSGSEVSVPILRLDAANVRELEESTLEDRKKRHLFQFPQNSPVSQVTSPMQQNPLALRPVKTMTKSYSLPATSMKFVEDDDADDYDHLSPLKNGGATPSEITQANKPKMADQEKVNVKHSKKVKKREQQKANGDVGQSMPASILGKAGIITRTEKVSVANLSSNGKETHSIAPVVSSDAEEVPPPVPKKYSMKMLTESKDEATDKTRNEPVNWKTKPGGLQSRLSGDPEAGTAESMKVPGKEDDQVLSSEEMQYKTEGKSTNMESTSFRNYSQPKPVAASAAPEERVAKKASSKNEQLHSHPVLGKSTERSSVATRGDPKVHRKAKEKVPPPIPPKTTHIKREDRDAHGNPLNNATSMPLSQSSSETYPSQETGNDSPLTDNHTDYFVHEQDIVPPPPEFSGMDFFASKGSKATHKSSTNLPQDDSLSASTSNTTLIAETEGDRASHMVIPSYDSPLQSGKHKSKHRKSRHQDAVKERGEMDTQLRVEDPSRQPGLLTVRQQQQQLQPVNPSSGDYPDTRRENAKKKPAADPISTKSARDVAVSENTSTNKIPPSSTAKTTQLTEKSKQNSPHANRSSTKENKANSSGDQQPQLPRRIPSRPAPPPPNRPGPSTSSQPKPSDQLTEEEKHALQMAYPANGKIPMMAPTVHDTDKHIQDMLTDISEESKSKRTNPISFGTCISCSKAITNHKDFCSHEGMHYHISCFHCYRCAAPLQGRSIFRIKTSLFCRDCYPTKSSSTSRLTVAHRPPQNKLHGPPGSEYYGPPNGEYYNPPPYHPTSTGGQITSV